MVEYIRPTTTWDDLSLPGVTEAGDDQDAFIARFIGRRVGAYEFESFLGRGGMGWVFLARHCTLLRPSAIKILCPEHQGKHIDSPNQFLAEARAAAALVHPHIVAVHNVGTLEDHAFIEMEYVPGQTLEHQVMERHPISLLEATDWLRQTCLALQYAHRQQVVHRDFKPANILIRSDGIAKLADFGLAKRLGEENKSHGLDLAGTPQFMAPELFAGTPAGPLSDVYAVGITYFYLLTRSFPFPIHTLLDAADLDLERTPPNPQNRRPEIPHEAVEVINRCLAKDPADRYPDCNLLEQDLRRVITSLRTLDALVREAILGLDASAEYGLNRAIVTVRVSLARLQRVLVEETAAGPAGSRQILVFSVCAAVHEPYCRRALELNAVMPYGALAIQNIDGVPHFVILKSFWQSNCEAADIRRGIQEIASWADHVEETLTGEDYR